MGWGDCDAAEIVYTGRLPGFALDAIDAWWENLTQGDGWYQLNLDHNIGTPFVNMNFNFKAPVTPRHKLKCFVWPTNLGKSSIEFQVEALQNETLCFTASFVCVFVVADRFEKIFTPPSIRELVEPLIRMS